MSARNSDLLRVVQSHGWTLARQKNHRVLRCPHGCCQVSCSASPSDDHAVNQTLRIMRKCEHWEGSK